MATSSEALTTLKTYVENMPSFSPATSKIIELSNDINASANDLVKVIRMDPVLTATVLKLVNSAYFSLAEKITGLNRALVYLGVNTIKNLALSTAVMDAFSTKNKELAELVKPVWKHSLATAVCCKIIAKTVGVPRNKIEEFFIAGLLHDMGKIALMQCFHGKIEHSGHLSLEEEKLRFGLSHDEVGSVILKKWNFSENLINAVKFHHAPISLAKKEGVDSDSGILLELPFIVHLSDALTYKMKINSYDEDVEPSRPLVNGVWETIGKKEIEILSALEEAGEELEKAEIFLNIGGSAGGAGAGVKLTHDG